MNGGVEGSPPEKTTPKEEDWLSLIKGFELEEIKEVFSQTLCQCCHLSLIARVQSVANKKRTNKLPLSSPGSSQSDDIHEWFLESSSESLRGSSSKSAWEPHKSPQTIRSGSQRHYADKLSPASVASKHSTSSTQSKSSRLLDDGIRGEEDEMLHDEQKEKLRFANIERKKNFVHYERINGKKLNVLQGLELHTQVFNAEDQKKIVEYVYQLQRMGQKRQLRERTYTEPSKWMRGKGRVTIQFGCCYNYAVDKHGNPPGIIRDEEVDPLPPIFIQMIKRMVRWHVLPPTCVPNSCIVNIYEEGDCIPPHIDHHDFLRPFCTISFLTECNILFGSNLKIIGPGEFDGPVSIPLPIGSVLVLKGNGADVAKHCVPAVPAKRISITFRKMDESKIPYRCSPDPELQRVQPLVLTPSFRPPSQQKQIETKEATPPAAAAGRDASRRNGGPSFVIGEFDFPPLGVRSASQQRGHRKNVSKPN